MSQLRRLKPCELKIIKSVKNSNGTFKDSYVKVDSYRVTLQELTDEVSANIYGAKINNTYRISSVNHLLELYLSSKSTDGNDNISKYVIFLNDKKYKIVSVKSKWIDIELL